MNNDQTTPLQERIRIAIERSSPVAISGLGSKQFYGRHAHGESLSTREHCGIISYEPSELVITARSGTPLSEIIALLDEHKQMLAFEPPLFTNSGTLGGAVATGLSGPRRPYSGSLRDFVLGIKCINGKGEVLSFGGQVMKNVAGYDVSRLMCGALGTLGVLLDISLKVLPKPEHEISLSRECNQEEALKLIDHFSARDIPVSAAAHYDRRLYLRLSGAESAVLSGSAEIAGDELVQADSFWSSLRDHTHAFFVDASPLWRLSLAPATPCLKLDGEAFIDWGGAQRWLKTDASADVIRSLCEAHEGHATLFRHDGHVSEVFHPLSPGLAAIHHQLKQSFDPHGIFNPQRMVAEW
ncbi:glycolate oxidase subunit GlcE [Sulfuriflexus mobilis]|uniref:glycolate oxidase subunit GlcE n=1 Tax=Sulfuriflexus mobilis TaxID=1811807 RepID=UPI000F81D647|nr:glycolate oxidase subunit GlcE [Sulfuriflexus mobilis]